MPAGLGELIAIVATDKKSRYAVILFLCLILMGMLIARIFD